MGRRHIVAAIGAAVLLLPLGAPAAGWASAPTPPPVAGVEHQAPVTVPAGTDKIIVTFDRSQADPEQAASAAVNAAAGQVADASVTKVTPITSKTVEVTLDQNVTAAQADKIGTQTETVAGVKAAEPSTTFAATTNDTYYKYLWDLSPANGSAYSVNAEDAWPYTTGSGAIVGVIDTGITPHSDLSGSTTSITGGNLIAGYDFISDSTAAGDGNGRDSNPTDAGDYCLSSSDVNERVSSWHGTHVTGIIAAVKGNSKGVVGVAPGVKVEPLRVLGRCGGTEADIIAAIRWGAGLSVTGLPANPHPVDVENLSLGGSGVCTTAMQDAINAAVGAGVTVVAAAGNSSQPVANAMPANCNNVISVAATGPDGTLAGYSNYGTSSKAVTISAPGGSNACASSIYQCIVSTWNNGETTPKSESYVGMAGTSMAAPHVAAAAAMLRGLNPNLTPAQVRTLLTGNVTPLPSPCTTTKCGAGLVNVSAAVRAEVGSTLNTVGDASLAYTGTAVGSKLTASVAGAPAGTTVTYQWQRDKKNISGATKSTYTPTSTDLAHEVRAQVQVGLGSVSVSRYSAGVTIGYGTFVKSKSPYISGTYKKGRTLTGHAGTWTPSASTVKYRWLRNGASISGATKSKYKLGSKDKGKYISVRVTLYRSGYTTTTVYSSRHKIH